MISNNTIGELISSPTRQITAGATLYDASDGHYLSSWRSDNLIKSIKIERIGDNSKFFGFGVCQKSNLKLVDAKATIKGSFSNTFFRYNFKIKGYDSDIYAFPDFYVTEVHRDENTGELSITSYDKLYKASSILLSEVELPEAPYSIVDIVAACANALGIEDIVWPGACVDCVQKIYENGANLEGTETIRDLLDDAAEATQTIYFIDSEKQLRFKILKSDNEGRTITKEDYFTLKTGDNRRLSTIYRTTELGDDVYVNTGVTGTTQYVRDNAFWDVHEDLPSVLNIALERVGGLTINQFECSWRGDIRLEIGDKLELITKNDSIATSYLLNDIIEYNGGFSQKTEWKFEDNEAETAENPATLGEALKKTYAKVDKVNKEIEIVASETSGNTSEISALRTDTTSIQASVEKIETINETVNEVSGEVAELTTAVNAKMTNEQVQIEIQKALDGGVEKVETSTGFTFDEDGLTIEKTDSETNTKITENGMYVYIGNLRTNEDGTFSGEIKLTANKDGVKAEDLHATTYLIIGTNSRFEDYGSNRTGCFWIGG